MALYAIITGDATDETYIPSEMEQYFDDHELVSTSLDAVQDDDAVYEEVKNCEAGIVLGDVPDEGYETVEELARELPLIGDSEYDALIGFDAEDELGKVYHDTLEQAASIKKAERLRESVSSMDSLAIILHDTPDPDAISSGIGLQQLADHYSVDADIYHTGEINHQENQALVTTFGFDLTQGVPDEAEYDGMALLDTAPTNISHLDLDGGDTVPFDIVIDHHQGWDAYDDDVSFIDVDEQRGATASMLFEYLDLLDIEPDTPTATALMHGIRSDTNDLDPTTDDFTEHDVQAAAELYGSVDSTKLEEIVGSTKTVDTAETLAKAIENREMHEARIFSYVEDVADSDAIPQAADYLVDLEGVNQAIVGGVIDGDTVKLSARNRDSKTNIGNTLHEKFMADEELGNYDCTGGGHSRRMGGATIPLSDFGMMDHFYEEDGDNEELHISIKHMLKNIVFDLD